MTFKDHPLGILECIHCGTEHYDELLWCSIRAGDGKLASILVGYAMCAECKRDHWEGCGEIFEGEMRRLFP